MVFNLFSSIKDTIVLKLSFHISIQNNRQIVANILILIKNKKNLTKARTFVRSQLKALRTKMKYEYIIFKIV